MSDVVVVIYCGSSLTKSLYDVLLRFKTMPILVPAHTPIAQIMSMNPRCIMITGSPEYPNDPFAPRVDEGVFSCGVPVLGICYGMQIMAIQLGGKVKRMNKPELECIQFDFNDQPSSLFQDFTEDGAPVWMLHTCKVTKIPDGFTVTGSTKETKIGAMEDEERGLYAVQFHPEHKGKDPASQAGHAMIWNFLTAVCGYTLSD
jgi:GMP synthase (glutamine-hydrolysing)